MIADGKLPQHGLDLRTLIVVIAFSVLLAQPAGALDSRWYAKDTAAWLEDEPELFFGVVFMPTEDGKCSVFFNVRSYDSEYRDLPDLREAGHGTLSVDGVPKAVNALAMVPDRGQLMFIMRLTPDAVKAMMLGRNAQFLTSLSEIPFELHLRGSAAAIVEALTRCRELAQ